jgi:hypothetical protein
VRPVALLLGIGAAALGILVASKRAAISGLVAGEWYRIAVRSSLDRTVFGDDAARQQAQALLGRQGFDVRRSTPNANDRFAYELGGIYRGDSGELEDVSGLLLIAAAHEEPEHIPDPVEHLDVRPVPVEPGRTYFGRASISWPLSMLVTRDRVISALTEQGFAPVEVFTAPEQLGPDWPASERGGDLFVRATYAGPAKTFDVPRQVVSVWR